MFDSGQESGRHSSRVHAAWPKEHNTRSRAALNVTFDPRDWEVGTSASTQAATVTADPAQSRVSQL